MGISSSFIGGVFLLGMDTQMVSFVAAENMFINRSHSRVALRQCGDV
jgi:hypothetical protein